MSLSILADLLKSDGGSIVVNKYLINALGPQTALIFGELISKQSYFEELGQTNDGWFYETSKMIELNTGYSYFQQKKSLQILSDLKLIETSIKGVPAKKFFRITSDENLIRNILEKGKANRREYLKQINSEENEPKYLNPSSLKNKELDHKKLENLNIKNSNVINNRDNNNRNKNTYIVENEENLTEKEQIPYKEIIEYLNEKTGKQYRDTTPKTRELIKARWKEGFTLEDFKKVIDNKTLEWKNTKWENYLRPVTLFSTKFESYLNDDPNIILRKKKEESKKEEYNIQEFFERLEIDYIIELTGNEYMAKKRFNEFAEKFGVDKDSRTLFNEFSSWCKKLRVGERV